MARPKMVREGTVFADVVIDLGSVTNATAAEQSATVNGARPGFPVIMWCEALEDGLTISNVFCSALNTVKFRVANVTAAPIDPASHTFRFVQF